jgi:predicted enzyme related to lactoylglutathione lyase
MSSIPRYPRWVINGIDAHYYLAKDLARAIAFYRDTLGLEVAFEFGSGVEFALRDGTAFGLGTMPNGAWIQCGGVMFAVSDLEAALERVRAGGGTTLSGMMETPVCWTSWCNDTEGNSFALHRRKE